MAMCSGSDRSLLDDEKVDSFTLCEHITHDIEAIVQRGNLLSERQCRGLSSKLLQTIENIRTIKDVARGSSGLTFTPNLKILYLHLEKAKLLVSECAEEDWTAVAVFQCQNEISFEKILLDVWLWYRAIYECGLSFPGVVDNILPNRIPCFESVSAIEDQEDLRRRLERLASEPCSVKVFCYFFREQVPQKQCLARHLLKKLSCTSQECLSNVSDVCKASLWMKELEPPRTWGNSNFLGVGSGANGVCRTQWLGVPCARKEFHGTASEVTFLKEASILAHLKHPRIVNFICCGNGEEKGDRFIAMELMEKSLFDVIKDRKGVPFAHPVVIDIILQIAEGMRYLHEQGVAHRDLKPQNVVVKRLASTHLNDQYYCVKLVDFGMSKTKVEVSKSDTISYRGVGTTRYRAPEVHPNAHPDGLGKANWFKVDVYSFAMTCAHVLSLKAPFADMEQLSELYTHLLAGKRPKLPGGLPERLVNLLGMCWYVRPDFRPPFPYICQTLEFLRYQMLGVRLVENRFADIYGISSSSLGVQSEHHHRNGAGVSRKSNCLSVASTSYYTAKDKSFCDGAHSVRD